MTTSPQQRAIRLVVVLLVASIGISVLSTALALTTHAVAPGPNQILIFVVALLYAVVIRRLRAGSAKAYRRVRIVSAAGFVAATWQLFAGAYPIWLRPLQVAQLGVLAALIVAVNRRIVRAAFPAVPDLRPRNRRAALLLALLAPLCAEVSLGTVPLRMWWAWLVFAPLYSAGALFLREILRRTAGGYGSLLLLGLAYGLVEEGLVLQSLTSPHLYGAAGWAPRLLGVNTAYTEVNLVYHALFSVAIPVILTEFVFASHGPAPYLRRGGLIATGVIALLAGALLRVSVPPSEDPGYTIPPFAAAIIALLAATLIALALRPRRRGSRPGLARRSGRPSRSLRTPPGLVAVAVLAGVAIFGFLALIWPFGGAKHPSFTHGDWSLLPMAAAALIVAAALHAARSYAGTPRHRVAAGFGALVGHTLFGLVGNADAPVDRLFLAAVATLTAIAGVTLLRHRTMAPAQARAASLPEGARHVRAAGLGELPEAGAGDGRPAGLGEAAAEALAGELDVPVAGPRQPEQQCEETGHREQLHGPAEAPAEDRQRHGEQADQRHVEQIGRVADPA